MSTKMSTRKKRRIRLIILGIALLAVASVAIGYGFSNKIELYKSPTEIVEGGAPEGMFRVGGLVEEGSLQQNGQEFRFLVTDNNEAIEVAYSGLLPDLFAENQGTIARGHMEGDVFVANEILAKHDENYMPREVVETLKKQGVYQE